jgi:catechol 2,3-dioxygenase-like lactoylglutathione lyase family enzyme
MRLGAFSVSLAVQDLAASRELYAKLGFEPAGGDGEHWQILRSGDTVLGLFQGMFEQNILTFNPRWDQQAQESEGEDVRAIAARLREEGLDLVQETNLDGEGPASFVLVDPDGNPVLFDQHAG